jgi:hypothetical protein
MHSTAAFPSGSAAAKLTAQRLTACDELVRSVSQWLLHVDTPQDAVWLRQRQTELILRARQSMLGLVLLARNGLWIPSYATARMLLEDAAVVHWLSVHPTLEALERRWDEHLVAARYGDIKAQRELGIDVDVVSAAWLAELDEEAVARTAKRHRDGASHWTGKSVAELAAGAAARTAPHRRGWARRTGILSATVGRMQGLVSTALHHSPAASQNWYSPSAELLPDGLRVGWLAFGLHAAVALEDLAPKRFDDLCELIQRQAEHFWTEKPARD